MFKEIFENVKTKGFLYIILQIMLQLMIVPT